MPFTAKSGKFNASINTVEFGTGDKAVKIGGENVFPLYSFDAAIENAPKVGIEITDFGMEHEPECIKKYYEGCATLADMARKAASMEGVDFLSFRMEGGDPNGANKSTEELIGELKEIADVMNQKYGEGTVDLQIKEQYRNMAEKIRPCYHLIENAKKACENVGIVPKIQPIRGGTDGARLSFMGLPCPNLGTGGYAFHGPYEHITVEGMDKSVEILMELVKIYGIIKKE